MRNTAPCTVATKAATTAARILLERLPLLASTDPADQARAHRLALAVAEVLDAEGELMEQDNRAGRAALQAVIAEGFREGMTP